MSRVTCQTPLMKTGSTSGTLHAPRGCIDSFKLPTEFESEDYNFMECPEIDWSSLFGSTSDKDNGGGIGVSDSALLAPGAAINCPFPHFDDEQISPARNTRRAFHLQENFDKFHSGALFLAIFDRLRPLFGSPYNDFKAWSDGFQLLKHLPELERYLESMRNDLSTGHSGLFIELELFVKGFLADNEPFMSYGLTTLYEKRYIHRDRWQAFHRAKFESDVDNLESTFFDVGKDVGPTYQAATNGEFVSIRESALEVVIPGKVNGSRSTSPENSSAMFDKFGRTEEVGDYRYTKANPESLLELLSSLGVMDMRTTKQPGHEPLLEEDAFMLLTSDAEVTIPFWTSLSMDPTSDLQRLISHNRSILQGSHESPEHALWMAVTQGNLAQVDYILRCATNFAKLCPFDYGFLLDQSIIDHASWSLDLTLARESLPLDHETQASLDIMASHSGLTILMAGVRTCNTPIVQSLLRYGLDVDVYTPSGTALGLAAVLNCSDIIQLLLEEGADLTDALLSIKAIYQNEDLSSRAIMSRIQGATDILLKATRCTSAVPHLVRRLHEEFAVQHSRIRELSRNPSFAWCFGQDVANDRRAAWSTGFDVIRRLARGDVIHTVSKVIIFLTIVKSICAVEDSETFLNPNSSFSCEAISNAGSRFRADLPRWQMLFVTNNDKLRDFRRTIKVLWDIELETWQDVKPDASTSDEFQRLARTLVAGAAHFFELELQRATSPLGLISSQEKWRLRNQQCPDPPFSKDSTACVIPEKSKPPWENAEGTRHQDRTARDESNLRSACTQSIADSDPISLVSLIMAGAIFGIFIAFLISRIFLGPPTALTMLTTLGFCYLRAKVYDNSTSSSVYQYRPRWWSLQSPVIQAVLDHITKVLKTTNLLTFSTIELLKSEAEIAIVSCRISEFPSLIAWIEEYASKLALNEDNLQGFRSYIKAFGSNWASTYAVQASYRLLEVYLGFNSFVNIVPQVLLRTESPRVEEMENFEIQPILEGSPMSNQCIYSHFSMSRRNSTEPSPLGSAVSNCNTVPSRLDAPKSLFWTLSPNKFRSSRSRSSSSSLSILQSATSGVTKVSSLTTATPHIFPSTSSNSSNRKLCQECKRTFPSLGNLNRHRKDKHEKRCEYFTRNSLIY
ncbi:hypothetical protein N431DRAFT_556502 [Stipitochalara longipes BDJ]|nr:hypothetical protein N431DRAFT_556502 [Stipitochalara longipes BDJ]